MFRPQKRKLGSFVQRYSFQFRVRTVPTECTQDNIKPVSSGSVLQRILLRTPTLIQGHSINRTEIPWAFHQIYRDHLIVKHRVTDT